MVTTLALVSPARAEWSFRALSAPRDYESNFGARFWYGRADTAKDLYDLTGGLLVSRLTYQKMATVAGEIFGRLDLDNGWFVKGLAGGGFLLGGQLIDEDFPPLTIPYSSTTSDQRNGTLLYGSFDGGLKLAYGPDFYLGVFAGYFVLAERVDAYGCTQTATNPVICSFGSVGSSTRVISQSNTWQALRVGVDAMVKLGDNVTLAVDAAWLPLVWLNGADTHWLRIGTTFNGPTPEDGTGTGWQVDAFLNYQVTPLFGIGVGGRYWEMATDGFAHFEVSALCGCGGPQVLRWRTRHIGGFIQATLALDALAN